MHRPGIPQWGTLFALPRRNTLISALPRSLLATLVGDSTRPHAGHRSLEEGRYRIFSANPHPLQAMADDLTIIVPVYNEEESLVAFFRELDPLLSQTPLPTKVLFVNDGSTDRSLAILKEQCTARLPQCAILQLDRNYGLSTAIKAGIDHCQSTLIGYIDADLQTRPIDFLGYLPHFPEYDMVNGIRRKRRDRLVKRLSSKVANAYRRLMIDDRIEDTCCPLKILKTSFARQMPFFTGMHRFMPALVQLQGGRVKQVEIPHYPRHAGTSKYNLRNRLIGPFFDTLAFRWMRSRSIRYGVVQPPA